MIDSEGAPADGLQQVVDGLAARLGRSVAVDDTHGRLVVASRHFGDEDPLRTYAVMQRSSDPRVIEHLTAHGIHGWTSPGRVPPAADLAFKARICCPVRCAGIRFGHLFLIDDDVQAWEIDLAAGGADQIGQLLHRRLVLHERDQAHREALARDLVAPDCDTRTVAGRVLLGERIVDAVEPAAALRLALLTAVTDGPDPTTAVRVALDRLARRGHPGRVLTLVTGRDASVLLLGDSATPATGRDLADRLVAELGPGPGADRVVVGLGPVHTGPDAARRSHEEARSAAEAAALLPTLGDVVESGDLGAYALLLALPRHLATAELVPEPLRRLIDHDAHGTLADTLETYLDCCGDATRTATALRIHRSTLYYRLGRITTLAGVDLQDGAQRLALHLGVKLCRVLRAYG